MERLGFGWKKSIHFYHFFEKNSSFSLCDKARYYQDARNYDFLSDVEITNDMKICDRCRTLAFRRSRNKIVSARKQHRDQKEGWQETICPECKSKVTFWNGDRKDTHVCTVCNGVVTV